MIKKMFGLAILGVLLGLGAFGMTENQAGAKAQYGNYVTCEFVYGTSGNNVPGVFGNWVAGSTETIYNDYLQHPLTLKGYFVQTTGDWDIRLRIENVSTGTVWTTNAPVSSKDPFTGLWTFNIQTGTMTPNTTYKVICYTANRNGNGVTKFADKTLIFAPR